MKFTISLPSELYSKMLDALANQFFTEKLGEEKDMDFYRNDFWLCDTAVIDRLHYRRGAWDILLLFAHYRQPLQFLSRHITRHPDFKRAGQIAHYMRRQAAKDQRGTLVLDIRDVALSHN
jgi:hypothetical protein